MRPEELAGGPPRLREEVERLALKGTTTVGIKVADGVVLAADKRASSQTFVASKKARKILKVDDKTAVTISGVVADAQFLVNNLKAFSDIYRVEHGRPMAVGGKARYLSLLLRSYGRLFLIAHMLVGGIDDGGPALFGVDFFGTVSEEVYTAAGSGSPVALAVIEERYDPAMTLDEAEFLALDAMAAALSRDTATGDGIDVAEISGSGLRLLSPAQIESILRSLKR